MTLGLLKVIIPIQRIEPAIQKKARPLPLPHDKTPLAQRLGVLRQDQVDLVALQMAEGPDDAVRRHDGLVFEHEAFEPLRGEDMLVQRERRIHDQGVRGEREEVGAVWVERHGVADGRDQGPAGRRAIQFVRRRVGVECSVACWLESCVSWTASPFTLEAANAERWNWPLTVPGGVIVSVLLDLLDIRIAHPRPIKHRNDDDFGRSSRWSAGRGGE